ncbi:hypothetical protein [Aureimonas sp. N4]|uniref:hypothetical protein n=1 Tax=Aureimonas sp. N4 TaxID=1638165 RepID=UPI0007867985|nr:hypothetical protein [Aureimonas sp. N4]
MTRYEDVGGPLTDDLTDEPLVLSVEELGAQIWGLWKARIAEGCTPAEFAAALRHAVRLGYCRPGDPAKSVPADAEDASLQVRARSLYRHLLTLHPDDREEGLAIARAIVATPASWQRVESRDLTVRDCVYAARSEAAGEAA